MEVQRPAIILQELLQNNSSRPPNITIMRLTILILALLSASYAQKIQITLLSKSTLMEREEHAPAQNVTPPAETNRVMTRAMT